MLRNSGGRSRNRKGWAGGRSKRRTSMQGDEEGEHGEKPAFGTAAPRVQTRKAASCEKCSQYLSEMTAGWCLIFSNARRGWDRESKRRSSRGRLGKLRTKKIIHYSERDIYCIKKVQYTRNFQSRPAKQLACRALDLSKVGDMNATAANFLLRSKLVNLSRHDIRIFSKRQFQRLRYSLRSAKRDRWEREIASGITMWWQS